MRRGLLFALLLLAASAEAHLLNMSKSSVSLADGGAVTVELALDLLATAGSREAYWEWSQFSEPMRSPDLQKALVALPGAVALTADGEPVALTLRELRFPKLPKEDYLDPLGWPRTEVVLSGKISSKTTPSTLQVTYLDSFRFEEPIANTLIEEKSGRKQTRWLVTGQHSPAFKLTSASPSTAGASREAATTSAAIESAESKALFMDMSFAGFRHIFPGGIDHLLFVAVLFFGSASFAGLVGIITLFTLAHSLSLGMTALGWFSAPASIVEPLILLSIVWIAAANLVRKARSHSSYLLVLLFGLVHGLGFASALRDIGLPTDFLLGGLLGFNLGVEAAQLAFLLMLGAVGFAARRLLPNDTLWKRRGSMLVIGVTLLMVGTRYL
ncbi:HupE/UreJ family protein [Congregibacter variabilis]|uniref:HupE/UreJ family protein n=1 Tax=Congregibacter variabilis TaxID=3081200 RepID=A0ABZ0I1V4_9GAMM|nr:HupE/UreJ family protein [Congregibacter sp. IMCC43200]